MEYGMQIFYNDNLVWKILLSFKWIIDLNLIKLIHVFHSV